MASLHEGFYTMKGYNLLSKGEITSAMEDYLEMIARRQSDYNSVRVVDLSNQLHVKASSVTKMIQQLAGAGLVNAKRYGEITLTKEGMTLGRYLLYRHDVLHRFLCLLNNSTDELEQVEKIEHYMNENTIKNLEQLINNAPEIMWNISSV